MKNNTTVQNHLVYKEWQFGELRGEIKDSCFFLLMSSGSSCLGWKPVPFRWFSDAGSHWHLLSFWWWTACIPILPLRAWCTCPWLFQILRRYFLVNLKSSGFQLLSWRSLLFLLIRTRNFLANLKSSRHFLFSWFSSFLLLIRRRIFLLLRLLVPTRGPSETEGEDKLIWSFTVMAWTKSSTSVFLIFTS